MTPFRCLLVLTLFAAASATLGRLELSLGGGRCGRRCGLTPRVYRPPRRGSGKCFEVFNFLSAGIETRKSGLSVAIDIFRSHSNKAVATNIDVAIETCLNLTKGITLILDVLIKGIAAFIQNIVIGIIRLLFCVLGNPWRSGGFISSFLSSNRACKSQKCPLPPMDKCNQPRCGMHGTDSTLTGRVPTVCKNDFGTKWGWRRILGSFTTWKDLRETHDLINIKARFIAFIKLRLNISSINVLKGTLKVVINNCINLCDMIERDISKWKRNDLVIVTQYIVAITAAVSSGYKVETGPAVVDQYSEYVGECYRKEFKRDVEVEWVVVKEEIRECDTIQFNGAYIEETSIESSESTRITNESGDDGGDGGDGEEE